MSAVTISFCLDDNRDKDLLDWLRSHEGSRSALIRVTLRQGLGQAGLFTVKAIRQAIREELALCYAGQGGPSAVSTVSSEPVRAKVNLDGLEDRLEDWE